MGLSGGTALVEKDNSLFLNGLAIGEKYIVKTDRRLHHYKDFTD